VTNRDEHTISRLESFSDVVMGFCLAELGLNLVVPKDPATFAASWPSLEAFAASFIFVSCLWWFHHKLFLTYFVLNPVTVTLNFVMLGSLALAIYFQEVITQFMAANMDIKLAVLCWMVSLAFVFGIVTVQYTIGIMQRRSTLDAHDMQWGVNRTFRTSVVTLLCIAFPLAYYLFGHLVTVAYTMVALLAILTFSRRIFVPIIVTKLLAGRPPASG
jgi:uncharacterized membrane protein